MQMVNEGIAIKPIDNVGAGDSTGNGGGATSVQTMEELKKLRDSNKQLQVRVFRFDQEWIW